VPARTLKAVGFDLRAIEKVGAAWLLGMRERGHVEAERGMAVCVSEVEHGHNGVSELFRLLKFRH
jgi:hypothetical protein